MTLRLLLLSLICFTHAFSTPKWMKDQINEDLAIHRKRKITQALINKIIRLDRHAKKHSELIRVDIKNSKISWKRISAHVCEQRAHTIIRWLEKFVQKRTIPNMTLMISTGDGMFAPKNLPIFVPSKRRGYRGPILIPDPEAMGGYEGLAKQVEQDDVPWEKKQPIAFWRGATTGALINSNNYLSFPRALLVQQSVMHPSLLDAKFVALVQFFDPDALRLFKQKMPACAAKVNLATQLNYRYLVNVDGNTCAWSRVFWILKSNSLLLKQEGEWTQWYYRILRPWKHYVPVERNLGNIAAMIEWAKAHDQEAKAIASRANELTKAFTQDSIEAYVELLLREYAKCLR